MLSLSSVIGFEIVTNDGRANVTILKFSTIGVLNVFWLTDFIKLFCYWLKIVQTGQRVIIKQSGLCMWSVGRAGGPDHIMAAD